VTGLESYLTVTRRAPSHRHRPILLIAACVLGTTQFVHLSHGQAFVLHLLQSPNTSHRKESVTATRYVMMGVKNEVVVPCHAIA